jgi:transposase-like protein
MEKSKKNELTKNKRKYKSSIRYSESFKRQVVREIELGLTYQEAVLKYDLSGRSLITHWRKEFSSELASIIPKPMTPQEEKELSELKKRNEELVRSLKEASLRILGLETLIDVAEEELKIEIRKKPGSKQSND